MVKWLCVYFTLIYLSEDNVYLLKKGIECAFQIFPVIRSVPPQFLSERDLYYTNDKLIIGYSATGISSNKL